jgi:2-phosphosulfolactate phosphatase
MHIKVIQYSSNSNLAWIKNRVAVVIDVFRATSVIATALAHGAKSIAVASEINEAVTMFRQYGFEHCLLGGERKLNPIEGFHYGNSPSLYANDSVRDKVVVLTTTNGTKAVHACKPAKAIYACALLNCSAVATKLIEQVDDITIVCAGSHQEFSLEDAFCAGMLLSEVEKMVSIDTCDFGAALKTMYEKSRDNAKDFLTHSKAYRALQANGYEEDIDFCLQKNVYPVVPKVVNNEFVL